MELLQNCHKKALTRTDIRQKLMLRNHWLDDDFLPKLNAGTRPTPIRFMDEFGNDYVFRLKVRRPNLNQPSPGQGCPKAVTGLSRGCPRAVPGAPGLSGGGPRAASDGAVPGMSGTAPGYYMKPEFEFREWHASLLRKSFRSGREFTSGGTSWAIAGLKFVILLVFTFLTKDSGSDLIFYDPPTRVTL
ncbi:hypothetical protein L484_027898 [Morus notabilis]|uniref:Uncharacterized protein n=1 Tax=Morus notabilis TaxID=981085 RepID=W9SFG3_9ROSA|nr:hypothetical protein L484_027898 [Morus notabilis]